MAGTKGLTQAQRSYLVKRINEIANAKIRALGGISNYGAPARHCYNAITSTVLVGKHIISTDVLLAITEGRVKLRNKASLMADLKSKADDNANRTYNVGINVLTFIDSKSLEKFNIAKNAKAKADHETKQKRITAVRDEADKLKDSVMLEGHLAVALLEKFEKREF